MIIHRYDDTTYQHVMEPADQRGSQGDVHNGEWPTAPSDGERGNKPAAKRRLEPVQN